MTENGRMRDQLRTAFPLEAIEFSESLSLRPLAVDDLQALVSILAGDAQMTWTRKVWDRENVEYLLRIRIDHYARHGFGVYAVVDRAASQLIGMAGVQYWNEECEDIEVIAYVDRGRWNTGIATQTLRWAVARAFSECPAVRRIVAATRHDNVAAQNVARALGMRPVGETEHYGAPSIFWELSRRRFEELREEEPKTA